MTLAFGAVGGLIAGLIMAMIGYALPIPMMMNKPFFVAAIHHLKMNSPAVTTGWALHIFTSLVIGVIFAVLTSKVAIFKVSSLFRGLIWGAAAGILVYLLLFLPIIPGIMTSLFSMGDFMSESFGYNLVFGIVLGLIVAGLTTARLRKP